jgi:hypothetical protein
MESHQRSEFQGPDLLMDQSQPSTEGFDLRNNETQCLFSKSLSFGSISSSYRNDNFHHDSFVGSCSEVVKDEEFRKEKKKSQ